MKRVQSYAAPGITVTFDPEICAHSGVCLRTLPGVFDISRRRWVRPDGASPGDVRAAIDRCPSGALQYEIGETAGVPDEPETRSD